MMNSIQLGKQLDEMMKETSKGAINWKMTIESTDDLDKSLKETYIDEAGVEYQVDECFVEYQCNYKKKDFCMISYEHVLTAGDTTRMTCLIFLPPMGMRYFDVAQLSPYAITADAYISGKVHSLWELLMSLYRSNSGKIELRVIDPLK